MKHSWTWQPATGTDVRDIVNMAVAYFQNEIDSIFTPDPLAYERNLMQAVVTQFYTRGAEMLQVARCSATNRLLGYVWAHRSLAPWSDDPMCAVRMVHVDMTLSARDRFRMVVEMIMLWETWCIENAIPVVCSTSVRGDQEGFMRVHQRMGYTVRGSYAYKRLGN